MLNGPCQLDGFSCKSSQCWLTENLGKLVHSDSRRGVGQPGRKYWESDLCPIWFWTFCELRETRWNLEGPCSLGRQTRSHTLATFRACFWQQAPAGCFTCCLGSSPGTLQGGWDDCPLYWPEDRASVSRALCRKWPSWGWKRGASDRSSCAFCSVTSLLLYWHVSISNCMIWNGLGYDTNS